MRASKAPNSVTVKFCRYVLLVLLMYNLPVSWMWPAVSACNTNYARACTDVTNPPHSNAVLREGRFCCFSSTLPAALGQACRFFNVIAEANKRALGPPLLRASSACFQTPSHACCLERSWKTAIVYRNHGIIALMFWLSSLPTAARDRRCRVESLIVKLSR